jgi:hypothetical protein
MRTILMTLLGLFFGTAVCAQTNTAVVKYQLERFTTASTNGGDLVIDPNPPRPNGVLVCPPKNLNFQQVFQSDTPRTVAIDINNNGGGDSCVTLQIETSTGTIKKVIAADTQSGVYRFTQVKSISLSIQHSLPAPSTTPAKSSGTATLWF